VVGGDGETKARVRAALRFCLSFPAVATAIPGMLTAEEVETNAAAGEVEPYAQDMLERMRDIYCQYEDALSA
jgi:aryl-alcohol dehydrogenase-like predicted oxidoreductase